MSTSMDAYVDLCSSFGLPGWVASLLCTAKCLKSDRARRKKFYRLLQRKLFFHGVGVERNGCQPTYVYPAEVKKLLRSVFSQNVCDYADPCHDQVVYITIEDLHKVKFS